VVTEAAVFFAGGSSDLWTAALGAAYGLSRTTKSPSQPKISSTPTPEQ